MFSFFFCLVNLFQKEQIFVVVKIRHSSLILKEELHFGGCCAAAMALKCDILSRFACRTTLGNLNSRAIAFKIAVAKALAKHGVYSSSRDVSKKHH